MQKGNGKFCPRCGAQNNSNDAFCIRCGYNFGGARRGKKSSSLIVILIIIIVGWIVLRTFLKKPIIPTEVIDIIKNFTANKTS